MHTITPIAHLTTAQLRDLGSAAADRGEDIYKASIRAGFGSAELLIFEQRFAREQVGGQGV